MSILDEALAVVNGPRQDQYGDPVETQTRVGQAWAGILGVPEISAKEVALMMIALKLVREAGEGHHRDNLVDAAGYAHIAALAADQEQAEAEGWGDENAPCPMASICQSCPCAGDDDVCFPCEREKAEAAQKVYDATCGDPECIAEGPCDCKGCDEPENGEDDEPVKFDLRDEIEKQKKRNAFRSQLLDWKHGVMQEVLHGPEREAFWADLGRPPSSHDFCLPLKFRAGDRVRVVDGGYYPGGTGRVEEPYVDRSGDKVEHPEYTVKVRLDSGGRPVFFSEAELELIR